MMKRECPTSLKPELKRGAKKTECASGPENET